MNTENTEPYLFPVTNGCNLPLNGFKGRLVYYLPLTSHYSAPLLLCDEHSNFLKTLHSFCLTEKSLMLALQAVLLGQDGDPGRNITMEFEPYISNHTFVGLRPGSTYALSLAARTGAGYGKPLEIVVYTRAPRKLGNFICPNMVTS